MQDKPGSFHRQCKQSLASRVPLVHSQELHQQTIQLSHIAFEIHTCHQDFISTTNIMNKSFGKYNKLHSLNTYPHPSGNFNFWQLNHESPVSAITAVSLDSIFCICWNITLTLKDSFDADFKGVPSGTNILW